MTSHGSEPPPLRAIRPGALLRPLDPPAYTPRQPSLATTLRMLVLVACIASGMPFIIMGYLMAVEPWASVMLGVWVLSFATVGSQYLIGRVK